MESVYLKLPTTHTDLSKAGITVEGQEDQVTRFVEMVQEANTKEWPKYIDFLTKSEDKKISFLDFIKEHSK